MNVYDFDNTIYDGESTFDFYLYCVKHHPKCIKFIFVVVWSLVKYKLCLVSENQLMSLAKKYVSDFIKCCPDAENLANSFCDKNFKKIKTFYRDLRRDDDIIVSASFGFLLRPFFEKLGVRYTLTSEVDLKSGEVKRLCYRKNKVELFKEKFDADLVKNVYTDSLNDKPLMSLANSKVFLVRGEKIKEYANKED